MPLRENFPQSLLRIIAYCICLKDKLRETSTNSEDLSVPQNAQIYFTSQQKASEFFPVDKKLTAEALLPALRRSLKTYSAFTIYRLPKRFTNTGKLGAHQLSLTIPRICGNCAPAIPAMQTAHLSPHQTAGTTFCQLRNGSN